MMRAAGGLAVILAVAALSGCPYSSQTPLGDPAGARMDASLVGTWRTQDPESREWHSVKILAFDEHQLAAVVPTEKTGETDMYRMFVTPIDSERFLSIRQIGASGDGEWNFARYTVEGDRMYLRLVDDALFGARTFAVPEELRAFIRAHLSDPTLYTAGDNGRTDTVWERVD